MRNTPRRPLHLALVTPIGGPIGGLEKFARFVTAAVLDAGGRVTVALSGQDVFDHPARPAGRLRVEPVAWLDAHLAGDREYRWTRVCERRRWFRQVRPDLALFVQSSNAPLRASVVGAWLARVPIVITHRTMPYVIPHVPSRRHLLGLVPGLGLHRRKLLAKSRLPAALAESIVYNNDAVRRAYEREWHYPHHKGETIANAVEAPLNPAGDGRHGERPLPGAPPNDLDHPIRVGYVGRLSREKRLDVLLQAFAALVTPRSVRLALYGDGPEEPALRAFASRLNLGDRVEWCGPTSDPAAAHRSLDIVVICSPRESSSNMILEAMAAAKAVVVSRTGGLPELVDRGRCGLIVSPQNVPELAAALARLVEDDCLRRILGHSAAAVARSRHDPGEIAAAWLQLLHRVADHERPERGIPAAADLGPWPAGTLQATRPTRQLEPIS